MAYHPVRSGAASALPPDLYDTELAGRAPAWDASQWREDIEENDPWAPDVPDHVHDSVNPHEPYSSDWYAWFGGSVPSGIFGPGAEECDPVAIYFAALAFCCALTGLDCDPTTTGVLYVFVGDDCSVEDAVCYTVSDGTVSPTGGWESYWNDIWESWLGGEVEEPLLGGEGVDTDEDDDELEDCRVPKKTGMRCEDDAGRPGYVVLVDQPYPCKEWQYCDPDKLHDAPGPETP